MKKKEMILQQPLNSGFIVQAYNVKDKATFLKKLKTYFNYLDEFETEDKALFKAFFRQPRKHLESVVRRMQADGKLNPDFSLAHFNYVVFLEFATPVQAKQFLQDEKIKTFLADLEALAERAHLGEYENIARVSDPAKTRDKKYVFNFLSTDKPETFLTSWQRVLGWFFNYTNLQSSLVLKNQQQDGAFPFINYAHWNSVVRLMVSLLLRPSIKTLVSEELKQNAILPSPILFKRVRI